MGLYYSINASERVFARTDNSYPYIIHYIYAPKIGKICLHISMINIVPFLHNCAFFSRAVVLTLIHFYYPLEVQFIPMVSFNEGRLLGRIAGKIALTYKQY